MLLSEFKLAFQSCIRGEHEFGKTHFGRGVDHRQSDLRILKLGGAPFHCPPRHLCLFPVDVFPCIWPEVVDEEVDFNTVPGEDNRCSSDFHCIGCQ